MSYYGPSCPHCGSDKTMTNMTPMGPEDLAKNPYWCSSCRSNFNTE